MNSDILNQIIALGVFKNKEFVFPELKTESHNHQLRWLIKIRARLESKNNTPGELVTLRPLLRLGVPFAGTGEILVETGTIGGKTREAPPTIITKGKNIGRRNETNSAVQALYEAFSKYERYKKQRIVDPLFPPPMLLQKWDSTTAKPISKLYLQPKLNGVRLIAHWYKDAVNFYSRTSTSYSGLTHLRAKLTPLLRSNPGLYLDGELYKHGQTLMYISGQARREDDAGSLEYHIFDCFWPNNNTLSFEKRWQKLQKLPALGTAPLLLVPTSEVTVDKVEPQAKALIKKGYEGAVVRIASSPYTYGTHNYRSDGALKVKVVQDEEYIITGFAGGRGKHANAIIYICKTEKGDEFRVVPNGTLEDRQKLFHYFTQNGLPANMKLTVSFAEKSPKGVPQQPKGLIVRTYENGSARDPIAKILN